MADCPDHANSTVDHGWQHCFTLPREVVTDGRTVLQRPVVELAGFRGPVLEGEGSLRAEGLPAFDLEVSGIRGPRCAVTLAGGLDVTYDAAAVEVPGARARLWPLEVPLTL